MKKLNWLVLMIFSVATFSCSDDDEGVLDSQSPMVTIATPTEGQNLTFVEGEEFVINVDFSVEDDYGLEEVSIWATPPGGMSQMLESWSVSDFLNDNTEFDRDDFEVVVGSPQEGNYLIEVQARDEQGNPLGTDQVTVSLSK